MFQLNAVAVSVALMLGIVAEAQVYEEDFEGGANGWTAAAEAFERNTGGVDGGAYLEGHRSVFRPIFLPSTGPASDALTGDLTSLYGTKIEIRYFARNFVTDAVSGPPTHDFFSDFPDGVARWLKQLPVGSSSEWQEYVVVIDADWSDEEAEANGWIRFSTDDGTKSWSDTIRNVTTHRFYSGDCARVLSEMPCPSTTDHETGIDEVRVSGVAPVPSLGHFELSLLAATIAAVGAVRSRRQGVRRPRSGCS